MNPEVYYYYTPIIDPPGLAPPGLAPPGLAPPIIQQQQVPSNEEKIQGMEKIVSHLNRQLESFKKDGEQIKSTVKGLKNDQVGINNAIDRMKKEQGEIKANLIQVERRMNLIERHSRKCCLILSGRSLSYQPGETSFQLVQRIFCE